jgi:hypothetical protein
MIFFSPFLITGSSHPSDCCFLVAKIRHFGF